MIRILLIAMSIGVCLYMVLCIVSTVILRFGWTETRGKYIGYVEEGKSEGCCGNVFRYTIDDKEYTGYTSANNIRKRIVSRKRKYKLIVDPEAPGQCLLCSTVWRMYLRYNLLFLFGSLFLLSLWRG